MTELPTALVALVAIWGVAQDLRAMLAWRWARREIRLLDPVPDGPLTSPPGPRLVVLVPALREIDTLPTIIEQLMTSRTASEFDVVMITTEREVAEREAAHALLTGNLRDANARMAPDDWLAALRVLMPARRAAEVFDELVALDTVERRIAAADVAVAQTPTTVEIAERCSPVTSCHASTVRSCLDVWTAKRSKTHRSTSSGCARTWVVSIVPGRGSVRETASGDEVYG